MDQSDIISERRERESRRDEMVVLPGGSPTRLISWEGERNRVNRQTYESTPPYVSIAWNL